MVVLGGGRDDCDATSNGKLDCSTAYTAATTPDQDDLARVFRLSSGERKLEVIGLIETSCGGRDGEGKDSSLGEGGL